MVNPLQTSLQKRQKKLPESVAANLSNDAVVISSVGAKHSNGCCPSVNQYMECKRKAGKYTERTNLILHDIVSHMTLKTNRFADADYIRSLMKKVLPGRKSITAKEIYNVRLRAIMFIKGRREETG